MRRDHGTEHQAMSQWPLYFPWSILTIWSFNDHYRRYNIMLACMIINIKCSVYVCALEPIEYLFHWLMHTLQLNERPDTCTHAQRPSILITGSVLLECLHRASPSLTRLTQCVDRSRLYQTPSDVVYVPITRQCVFCRTQVTKISTHWNLTKREIGT